MQTKNNTYITRKLLQDCMALAVWCLFALSCTTEEMPAPSIPGSQIGFTARLAIETPPVNIPKATRSQTSAEAAISEIRVLAFQNDRFQYAADGSISSSTLSGTEFEARLTTSASPVTLYLVANANEAIDQAGISLGDSQGAVKGKIQKAFSASGIQHPFPMFGEHTLPSLSESGAQISGIKMLRSIARADVIVDEAVSGFEMVSVQVFRARTGIQVIPGSITNNAVAAPSVPVGSGTVNTSAIAVTGNKSEAQLYFPEAAAPDESAQTTGATCIIVGGRLNNGAVSYYRIDFNLKIDGHPFGQILRNHKYIFNILKVNVQGESTPEEAANKPSAGMTAEVQSWDENSTDMWFEGDHYFGVSKRTLTLRPWAGTFIQSDFLTVNTDLSSYSVQWSDASGTPVDGTSPSTVSISNGNYEVTISNDTIRVLGLTNNPAGESRNDYFVILARSWKIRITIEQYGLNKHGGDLIRVLSFTGIGDLGSGYASDGVGGADAPAMRQILNVQFSPTGIFPFGGYHFTEKAALALATTLSSTEMSNYDVIFLPYAQYPSQTVAGNLMKWLDEKASRVLIVAADGTSVNTNVLNTAGDNLGWYYTDYSTPFSFQVNDETSLFTQRGLFGQVSASSYFAWVDATWGKAANSNPDVIPLLKTNRGDMVLGVNMKKRIVYAGEIQLFLTRTNGLSGNAGAVANDQDRLMANLWAWITETVLAGK